MPYKDKEKQRKSNKLRMQKVRGNTEKVTQGITYQGNEVSVWWGKAMANANRANDTKLGQGLTPEMRKSLEKLVKG